MRQIQKAFLFLAQRSLLGVSLRISNDWDSYAMDAMILFACLHTSSTEVVSFMRAVIFYNILT